MKRYINQLLQQSRSQFENSHAARRTDAPKSIRASGGLRAEDGYDWLRQIKRVRIGQSTAS
ncbi:hypothetical protein [Rhodanobacter ginsengiterrae]|uniref:hypothetical protein n=1 Tax=Rhodanobacter ginsengiterrae TaxID=2008451 RepID=UPI003CED2F4F